MALNTQNPTKQGIKASMVANTLAEMHESHRLACNGVINGERFQLVRAAKRHIVASIVRGTSAPAIHVLASNHDDANIDRLQAYYKRKAQAFDEAIQHGRGLKRALRRSELFIQDEVTA